MLQRYSIGIYKGVVALPFPQILEHTALPSTISTLFLEQVQYLSCSYLRQDASL